MKIFIYLFLIVLAMFFLYKKNNRAIIFTGITALLFIPLTTWATASSVPPSLGYIRLEFVLFALTLLSVAIFHRHTMKVALIGLATILLFKFIFDSSFDLITHLFGETPLYEQLLNKELRQGEWPIILNLLGLLLGFAILAKQFEQSKVPEMLPRFLPNNWKGPFILLVFIATMSTFLDNIAAAMIGGTIAMVVFNKQVHIGYLVAIVAASNAGGAGSVVGDTTTTMMWIDGVNALDVTHAWIGSAAAIMFFGYFASLQQQKIHPVQKDASQGTKVDWLKVVIVTLILAGAIMANILADLPALGVWIAIILGALVTSTPWFEIKNNIKGTIFLLSLVLCASMMPVNELPAASAQTTFSLGFISAVFDNIPLTKLALDQGGYDWGVLAYAVGFGGSMIWFGSSAGVALTNIFPEAKSVTTWLKKGWHVIIAYVIGFLAIIIIARWNPSPPHKNYPVNEKHQTEQSLKTP